MNSLVTGDHLFIMNPNGTKLSSYVVNQNEKFEQVGSYEEPSNEHQHLHYPDFVFNRKLYFSLPNNFGAVDYNVFSLDDFNEPKLI